MEATLSVQQEATRLSGWHLSDHALLLLQLRPRGKKPPAERSIPDYVFRAPEYKVELNKYLAHTDWTGCSVAERWSVTKDFMIRAAA
eukprot:6404191-Pyramimonas_sp.AAC.1